MASNLMDAIKNYIRQRKAVTGYDIGADTIYGEGLSAELARKKLEARSITDINLKKEMSDLERKRAAAEAEYRRKQQEQEAEKAKGEKRKAKMNTISTGITTLGTSAAVAEYLSGGGVSSSFATGGAASSYGPAIAGGILGAHAGKKVGGNKQSQQWTPWGGQRTEEWAGAKHGGIVAGGTAGFISGGPYGAITGIVSGIGESERIAPTPTPNRETAQMFEHRRPVSERLGPKAKLIAGASPGGAAFLVGDRAVVGLNTGTSDFDSTQPAERYRAAGLGGIESGTNTVICTELVRQNKLDPQVAYLDGQYRAQHIDVTTYMGYMVWAPSVVNWMKNSVVITTIIEPFGFGWAYEMAHRIDPTIKGSIMGKVLLYIGAPICYCIGAINNYANRE